MANDKSIKIRAVLDSSGFDSEVDKLQNKLKKMQQQQGDLGKATTQLGGDTVLGKYSKQAFGEFNKDSKKELESMFASQKKEAINQNIQLKSKTQELDKLRKIETDLTKQQKQRVDLLEKEVGLIKERNKSTLLGAAETKKLLGDFKEDTNEAGKGKGSTPVAAEKPEGMLKGMLKAIGIAGIVKGAINAVVTAGTHLAERDRKILANNAQSANIVSKEMREDFQGKGSRGMFFAEQRKTAMNMAAKEQKSQGALDIAKTGGSILGGAAAGAAAGSIIPGLGTIAGGIVGAVGGFAGAMSSDKLRSRVFDQEQYQSMITKEGMQKYEGNLAAQKALDPKRTMAQEYFEGNSNRFEQLQRSGGMTDDAALFGKEEKNTMLDDLEGISNIPEIPTRKRVLNQNRDTNDGPIDLMADVYEPTGKPMLRPEGLQADNIMEGLFGNIKEPENYIEGGVQSEGYLIDQMKGGTNRGQYSEENILGKRAQILQGGGDTDTQELASTAAKFERNLGLTNAGSVFGKIAGTAGGEGFEKGTDTTEDSVKRIMAEAVKMGVDTSKMPQELSRFTQAAAEIMTQGGGLSDTAVSRFGGGLLGTSQEDINMGKSALDEATGRAKGGAGMQGQIGYGFMMGEEGKEILGEEAHGKMMKDSKMMNSLNQRSAEDLESSGLAKGYAKRLGIDEDKFMEFIKSKDFEKQSIGQDLEDKQKQLTKNLEGKTAEEKSEWMQGDEGSVFMSEMADMTGSERGQQFTGKKGRGILSQMAQDTAFDPSAKGIGVGDISAVTKDLETSPDTAAINQQKSQATGDITRVKALQENIESLSNAAKQHTEAAELYSKQFELFAEAAKNNGDALGKMKEQLDAVTKSLQENKEMMDIAGHADAVSTKP